MSKSKHPDGPVEAGGTIVGWCEGGVFTAWSGYVPEVHDRYLEALGLKGESKKRGSKRNGKQDDPWPDADVQEAD